MTQRGTLEFLDGTSFAGVSVPSTGVRETAMTFRGSPTAVHAALSEFLVSSGTPLDAELPSLRRKTSLVELTVSDDGNSGLPSALSTPTVTMEFGVSTTGSPSLLVRVLLCCLCMRV
jgi:hypothetical protein